MLRRRGAELPTTLNPATHDRPDGSGKSIKMDAPLVRAIRAASAVTKYSYLWLIVSSLFVILGWSLISRNSASIKLDCKSSGCTLTIHKPKNFASRDLNSTRENKAKHRVKIEFTREQLIRSDNILWDPIERDIVKNYGEISPTYDGVQQRIMKEEEPKTERPNKPWKKYKKKNKKKYKATYSSVMFGPDPEGFYNSYILVLRDHTHATDKAEPEDGSPSKRMQKIPQAENKSIFEDLVPFVVSGQDYVREESASQVSLEYIIHLRDFNIGQTRRLARTAVSKINAYAKGRRSNFIIIEARPISWQGLSLLILGIFSLVLSLLLGQFWEEGDPTKDGSYKKRMMEIKKRNEAALHRRKNSGKTARYHGNKTG